MSKFEDLTGKRFGKLTVIKKDENRSSQKGRVYWFCICDCGNEKLVSKIAKNLKSDQTKNCRECKKTKIGDKFNKLTVIKKDEVKSNQKGRTYWFCKCDCGRQELVSKDDNELKYYRVKSCGKCNEMMIGHKFGKLTIVKKDEEGSKEKGETCWFCKCDCGKKELISVRQSTLKNGATKSCNCIRNTKKGMSTSHRNIYNIWHGMNARCYNKNNPNYYYYGEKGITICKEWKDDFEKFVFWAEKNGYKEGLTIDRIDYNGMYEPDNCRFITNEEQQRNKSNNVHFTLNGVTKSIAEWSNIVEINKNTLKGRIERGWSEEELLNSRKLPTDNRKVKNDYTGMKIGRLLVIKRAENKFSSSGKKKVYWICQCTCENKTVKEVSAAVLSNALKGRGTGSCGCLNKDKKEALKLKKQNLTIGSINNAPKKYLIEINGEIKTAKDWSIIMNLSEATIRKRAKKGNYKIHYVE